MKTKPVKKGTTVRRKDGRPATPMDDVALAVSTFGLWVAVSLVAEAWDLYKNRPAGRSRPKQG